MRRIQFLINEARKNTNTEETDNISDELCASLLDRAQTFIQAYLFTKNVENRLFRGQANFTSTPGVDTYQLPYNIYATNSVNSVAKVNQDVFVQVNQISERARGVLPGYFCSDNNIVLSPEPKDAQDYLVSYAKRLPSLNLRYGKITAVSPTVITLDAGYKDLSTADDYFSVVNASGSVVLSGLLVDQTGADLTVSDTTGVTAGMYVVPGKYATDKSQLPDECESALLYSLETMINARQSSKDIQISETISEKFLNMIGDMFADNSGDAFQPPIQRYSEWV